MPMALSVGTGAMRNAVNEVCIVLEEVHRSGSGCKGEMKTKPWTWISFHRGKQRLVMAGLKTASQVVNHRIERTKRTGCFRN